MDLRLVSMLSETLLLAFFRWENECFAVVNSRRTLFRVGERRARSANPARTGSEGNFSTISLG